MSTSSPLDPSKIATALLAGQQVDEVGLFLELKSDDFVQKFIAALCQQIIPKVSDFVTSNPPTINQPSESMMEPWRNLAGALVFLKPEEIFDAAMMLAHELDLFFSKDAGEDTLDEEGVEFVAAVIVGVFDEHPLYSTDYIGIVVDGLSCGGDEPERIEYMRFLCREKYPSPALVEKLNDLAARASAFQIDESLQEDKSVADKIKKSPSARKLKI